MSKRLPTPGQRVRWIRQDVLGLSMDRLIDAVRPLGVRVSKSAVGRYERGVRSMDVDFAAALAELSGISVDWIVRGEGARGDALDALARVREALDQIEARYLEEPTPAPPERFRRVDEDED